MRKRRVTIAMTRAQDFTVLGYEFELESLKFVVHRYGSKHGWEPGGDEDAWSVTELLSGFAVPGCVADTRRDARRLAEDVMREKGPDKFRVEILKRLYAKAAA